MGPTTENNSSTVQHAASAAAAIAGLMLLSMIDPERTSPQLGLESDRPGFAAAGLSEIEVRKGLMPDPSDLMEA